MLKIVGALILIGAVGGGVYYYLSQPRVMSSYTESAASCSSPDARDFYEKGTAYFLRGGETGDPSTMPDTCDYYVNGQSSRSGQLRQSFCRGSELVTENIDCGIDSVCRQGRCVKGSIGEGSQLRSWSLCSDTDGGIDTTKRGWVEGVGVGRDDCFISSNKVDPENNGSFTDRCSGSDCYVYEYYCDDDTTAHKVLASPNGCENGSGL
ncbi:MAG: hypothetical protein Q7S05_00940 [bacterium]|nr:hypothetical protein [bacterium]